MYNMFWVGHNGTINYQLNLTKNDDSLFSFLISMSINRYNCMKKQ